MSIPTDEALIQFLDRIPGTQDRDGYVAHILQIGRMRPQARHVLEIGSFLGGSAIAWAYACPNAFVNCLDPAFAPYERGGESICHYHAVNNTRRAGVSHRVFFYGCYSEDMPSFIPVPVDILYIDGEHTYEAVKKDCAWLTHVDVGGFVAFDDWIEPVARAVEESFALFGKWEPVLPPSFIPRVFRRLA